MCLNRRLIVFFRSFISSNFQPASAIVIAPAMNDLPHQPLVQMTQLKVNFKIDKVRKSYNAS